VSVPISVSPARNTQIAALKLVVTFDSTNLKFEKLDRGNAAEFANADVTSELRTSVNPDGKGTSVLTIKASLTSAAPSARGIPAGLLGNLRFRIDDDSDGATIYLEPSVEATEVGSNSPLPADRVRTEEGIVYVLAPGGIGFGCFFFTH